jgi:asparagine synthase (glutamine-hydrolysing)
MCGIWALLRATCDVAEAERHTAALHARGPEGLRIQVLPASQCTLGFTRLAINGLTESGMQPMYCTGENEKGGKSVWWICNGEIYNWRALKAEHGLVTTSESDCSILGPLWLALDRDPVRFFRALDGVFSIVLVDEAANQAVIGRDPYGVRPLFWVSVGDGVMVASEMKGLVPGCGSVKAFSPGHFCTVSLDSTDRGCLRGSVIAYHEVPWLKNPLFDPAIEGSQTAAEAALRIALTAAVRKRLMTERPVAALLSGGIDSSLIAALVQRELKEMGKPSLETFSIGFEGSPDLFYARKVADHIGSRHTEVVVTPDDFFEAIPDVVQAIESYDITTVRASVGNWMVAREIARRSEAKVVFNGDGADEIFGSYLYFYRAPTDEAFEAESGRLLQDIHLYDVLRSDRSISSHGLEPRTPFLDKQFVAVARSLPTVWRRPDRATGRCEKWILRTAFKPLDLLPHEVLWRQKEAFSDGVSRQQKSWYQEIQERVPAIGSAPAWTHLPPPTAEAQYYRTLFDRGYGASCEQVIPYFWMPKWSGETKDPSARTLSLY